MSTNTNLNYLIHLPQQNGIFVRGIEAKKFLQGQVTCNLDNVHSGHFQLAAHCNAKGWVLSIFDVLQIDEACYFLRMPSRLCLKAKQTLNKYALFSKVTLSENHEWQALGITGPQAFEILKSVCDQDFPDLAPQDMIVLTMNEGKIVLLREIGELPRYTLLLSETMRDRFKTKLTEKTSLAASEMWDLWDIQMGIPCVYPETSEMALAPYFNLEALNAISYDKGCYVGQEVIARMHYRGKIKKHMIRAKVASTTLPFPGMEFGTQNDKADGFVVRVAPLNSNEYELLIILDDELSGLEKSFLFSEGTPTLSRLELPYRT